MPRRQVKAAMRKDTDMAKWVSDELREMAEPDQYGRTLPFAVYERCERGEIVTRNQTLAGAEAMADRLAAEGRKVHVSLDTCG